MSIKKKVTWAFIALLTIFTASFLTQRYSYSFYQEPIGVVENVLVEDGHQIIYIRLLNRNQEKLQLTETYYKNGATSPAYKSGDQLLLRQHGENFDVVSLKRDGYVLLLLALFVYFILMIGGKKGFYALIGITLNILLLLLALWLNQQFRGLSLLVLMGLYCILSVIISMGSLYGGKKVDLRKVVATLMSVFLAFFICLFVMDLLKDSGLRYEEMQFVTRPYRSIFLASLLLGAIGAALDNVVMIIATIDEIVLQQKNLSPTQIIAAGRKVANDTSASMINVLLFAYLSSAAPAFLFYLANGWLFRETFRMHLSLELLRALCGAIAIVLSVPASLGVVILQEKLMARRNRSL